MFCCHHKSNLVEAFRIKVESVNINNINLHSYLSLSGPVLMVGICKCLKYSYLSITYYVPTICEQLLRITPIMSFIPQRIPASIHFFVKCFYDLKSDR